MERQGKMEMAAKEREQQRLQSIPKKWNRREEYEFLRVLTGYGVDMLPTSTMVGMGNTTTTTALPDWLKFKQMAHLERKSDETLSDYYKVFIAMCKRKAGVKLSDNEKGLEGIIEEISEDHAKLILDRLELLTKLREIARNPQLDERLKLCLMNADTPDWWEPGRHDKELIAAVLKHGLYRSETFIFNDSSFSFADSEKRFIRELEAQIQRTIKLEAFNAEKAAKAAATPLIKDEIIDLDDELLTKDSLIKKEQYTPVKKENEAEAIKEEQTEETPEKKPTDEKQKVEETAAASADEEKEKEQETIEIPSSPKKSSEADETEKPSSSEAEETEKSEKPEAEKEKEAETSEAAETESDEPINKSLEDKTEKSEDASAKAEQQQDEDKSEKKEETENEAAKEEAMDTNEENKESTATAENNVEKDTESMETEAADDKTSEAKTTDDEKQAETEKPATEKQETAEVSDKTEKTEASIEESETVAAKSPKKTEAADDDVTEVIEEKPKTAEDEILDLASSGANDPDDDEVMKEKEKAVEEECKKQAAELKARFPDLEVIQPASVKQKLDKPKLEMCMIRWFKDFALERRIAHIVSCVENNKWPVDKKYSAFAMCKGQEVNICLHEALPHLSSVERRSETPDVITITTDQGLTKHLQSSQLPQVASAAGAANTAAGAATNLAAANLNMSNSSLKAAGLDANSINAAVAAAISAAAGGNASSLASLLPPGMSLTSAAAALSGSNAAALNSNNSNSSSNNNATSGGKKRKRHIAIDVETERAKLHALLNSSQGSKFIITQTFKQFIKILSFTFAVAPKDWETEIANMEALSAAAAAAVASGSSSRRGSSAASPAGTSNNLGNLQPPPAHQHRQSSGQFNKPAVPPLKTPPPSMGAPMDLSSRYVYINIFKKKSSN